MLGFSYDTKTKTVLIGPAGIDHDHADLLRLLDSLFSFLQRHGLPFDVFGPIEQRIDGQKVIGAVEPDPETRVVDHCPVRLPGGFREALKFLRPNATTQVLMHEGNPITIELPMTAMAAWLVRRARPAAMMFGDGMIP